MMEGWMLRYSQINGQILPQSSLRNSLQNYLRLMLYNAKAEECITGGLCVNSKCVWAGQFLCNLSPIPHTPLARALASVI